MITFKPMSALGAAVISLFVAAPLVPVYADAGDYEFQLVQPEAKKSDDAVLSVRLINKKTGKLAEGAVIFAKRIDMAPDGMEAMIMPIEQLPSTEPGIYRLKTQLVMPGNWRLSLGAKVQNETGTVENRLVFKVIP